MTKEFSWHDIEISEAFDRLGSSPEGLSEAEATARLEAMIRCYDPCISCATHFLHVDVDHVG